MHKFIIPLLVALFPSLSFAASFDCIKAATRMEKLICSDPQLSKSDEDLAASYSKALKEASDPAAIKKQQREWLADVRKRCNDVACFKDAYSARIAQLASGKNVAKQEKFSVSVDHQAALEREHTVAAPTVQIECEGFEYTHLEKILIKRISNRDGSSLLLKTMRCETEVILESGGMSNTLIKVKGGSAGSNFIDLNNDGIYEVVISRGCGMVNCSNTIYCIDPNTLKAKKVLDYFGFNFQRIGEYFISSDRVAGYGEYEHNAYKIIEYTHLDLAAKPSFTIHSYFDSKREKSVCEISLGQKYRQSELVKTIVNKICLPESIVNMGGHDY